MEMDVQNEEEGEMKTAQVEIAEDEVELINLTDQLTVVYVFHSCVYSACWPGVKALLFRIWY